MSLSLGFVLGIVFTVLKILGHIDWAWVWVLAPIWGEVVLLLILSVLIVTVISIFQD